MTELTSTPPRKEDLALEKLIRANENRDYTIYVWLMDAALQAKADSIIPHFGKVPEGAVIVDAGSGSGKLGELVARQFRGSRVYLLDLSHELLEVARENETLTKLVFGDATQKNFPENFIDIKYYSTVGHEIESQTFGGMYTAMANTFTELKPGGRVIVRDFAKPEITGDVYMKIISSIGEGVSDEALSRNIDYSKLSTYALFKRFHKEFGGGNAFSYLETEIEGEKYIKLAPEWAHEFYLRKDYTANWRQEIEEKYTYWTMSEAKNKLTDIGYVNVKVVPDPNKYILENRLIGKIALYQMGKTGLTPIDFPPTHMVFMGEKSRRTGDKIAKSGIETVNYQKILDTIKIDREKGNVQIGKNNFEVMDEEVIVGSKKMVFRLKENPNLLLKVVRGDTNNNHNVFKSMHQIVRRQHILKQMDTPHFRVIDFDREGPPYRYIVQESAPTNAVSAADLIKERKLTDEDIKAISKIVNSYEMGKKWQLDTNPYSWFRVIGESGETKMVYASGKVYKYDERWEFRKIGLLQWIYPEYVEKAENLSAIIPRAKDYEALRRQWKTKIVAYSLWKNYLAPIVQPEAN